MRTEILILLDRSGSMETTRKDVIGGFNAMIEAQKKEPGECYLTLVQFDGEAPQEVIYTRRPIQAVEALTTYSFVPRGSTPLYDAMARMIIDQGTRFNEALTKPEKVVMVVFTDGDENNSREYAKDQVKALVERQEREWQWTVTLVGANFDALKAGLGVQAGNTLNYRQTAGGTAAAFQAISGKLSAKRKGVFHTYSVDARARAADGDSSVIGAADVVPSVSPSYTVDPGVDAEDDGNGF